jgi:hypothetical protein
MNFERLENRIPIPIRKRKKVHHGKIFTVNFFKTFCHNMIFIKMAIRPTAKTE